jgi:hypothetical protein
LVHPTQIELSHLGKIECDEPMATIAVVLKIARALSLGGGEPLEAAEAQLPEFYSKQVD